VKTGGPNFKEWKETKGEKWIAKKLDELTEPNFEDLFREKARFQAVGPWKAFAEWVGKQKVRLASVALIGLAPFYSYSFEEEQKSAKAPLQIFAAALRRLRLCLSDASLAPHVRFIVIPDIVRIESEEPARFWRGWLGLDTLIWGSYVSAKLPRVWLNLENRQPSQPKSPRIALTEDRSIDTVRWHPVKGRSLDDSMLEVDQDDPKVCYLVVPMSLLRTIRERPQSLRNPLIS
jgi:hypothetical protein